MFKNKQSFPVVANKGGGGGEVKTYSAVINFPNENELVGTLTWNDEVPSENSFILDYEFQLSGVTFATLKNLVTKQEATMEGSTTDIYSFVMTLNGTDYQLFTLTPISGASNWTVLAQSLGGSKVSSLGGATGDITLGDGLSLENNQLSASGKKLYKHFICFMDTNKIFHYITLYTYREAKFTNVDQIKSYFLEGTATTIGFAYSPVDYTEECYLGRIYLGAGTFFFKGCHITTESITPYFSNGTKVNNDSVTIVK